MGFIIIDAHSHLWLKQDTVVEGLPIRTLENGRSLFMGEVRQMLPPFMTDGVNSAEVFLSNMDYAQVSAAVVELLGYGKVDFVRTAEGLSVTLPAQPLNQIAPVLRIAK